MKSSNAIQSGFTTVELLVTLFVGVLFIGSAYQVFMVILQDGTDSRDKAVASNLATSHLDKESAKSTACSGTPTVTDLDPPSESTLADVEITSTISWPYGCSGTPLLKRVEIQVDYGDSDNRKGVTHVRYAASQS